MIFAGVTLAPQMPMMIEELGVGVELGMFAGPLLLFFISKMPLAWSLTGQLSKYRCLFQETKCSGTFFFFFLCVGGNLWLVA